ncbi:hypothetical protein ABIF96_004449 [Bradyrhizobium ottawaense]|uniref:lipopolysaccharide biosynthesis protein n=1 Tax=Bradyrhizobium ottawaense TaxID=931866 RepID=UPI0038344AAC
MNVTRGRQHQVVVALFWSLAQNWGGRALSFVLFLVLARLLDPADFGLAALVAFILLLLSSIAEFGFGDALIQRRTLEPADVTLPFFCSFAASVLLAVLIALLATHIEQWFDVKGLAPLLTAASLSLPIGTATLFQEALYKRQMDFRVLAVRTMVATAISGVVGIACAYAGFGALSLVIQVVVQSAISGLWLWSQPRWLPMRGYDLKSFRELSGYSIHVMLNRLLDFAIVRTIDMIILSLYGVAALGIYTVGARVYIILMQLLTQAVMDVALSALSKIAHERDRIAGAYLRSVSLGALIGSPVFVLLAAIAPEFSLLLFGAKWGWQRSGDAAADADWRGPDGAVRQQRLFWRSGQAELRLSAQHPQILYGRAGNVPASLARHWSTGHDLRILAARGDPRHVCAGAPAVGLELEPVSAPHCGMPLRHRSGLRRGRAVPGGDAGHESLFADWTAGVLFWRDLFDGHSAVLAEAAPFPD